MAEENRNLLSEHTKDMTEAELVQLQETVSNMTAKELNDFRNSLETDNMGFFGEESV